MKKTALLSLLVVFLIMLLDGQLTTLLMNSLPFDLRIASRLLLLNLIFFSSRKKDVETVLIFLVIGLLYDSYYLNLIGIATTLLPVFASILGGVFRTLKFNLLNFVLMSVILIFSFEVLSYLLAQVVGLGSLRFEVFVVKTLAPTLGYNVLQSLAIYPIFLTILKKTRHRIVTLA